MKKEKKWIQSTMINVRAFKWITMNWMDNAPDLNRRIDEAITNLCLIINNFSRNLRILISLECMNERVMIVFFIGICDGTYWHWNNDLSVEVYNVSYELESEWFS